MKYLLWLLALVCFMTAVPLFAAGGHYIRAGQIGVAAICFIVWFVLAMASGILIAVGSNNA